MYVYVNGAHHWLADELSHCSNYTVMLVLTDIKNAINFISIVFNYGLVSIQVVLPLNLRQFALE